MGRLCIAKGCVNSKRSSKGQEKIHLFPTEDYKASLDSWIQSLKLSPGSKVQHFGVCSLHFLSTDYEGSARGKLKLRKDAVPKQYPGQFILWSLVNTNTIICTLISVSVCVN
jgi:hypothetical protein